MQNPNLFPNLISRLYLAVIVQDVCHAVHNWRKMVMEKKKWGLSLNWAFDQSSFYSRSGEKWLRQRKIGS